MILKNDYSEKIQYDYLNYPIYRKYCVLSSYPNYSAPSHCHDDIELIVILSGEMQYNVNGEIVTLRQGEGILVNSCQIHYGYSSAKGECQFLCILLHPMLLCITATYEHDFVMPIINHSALPFVHLSSSVLWQKMILKKIRFIYNVRKESAAPMKTQEAFMAIWILLYENSFPFERTKKYFDNDLIIIKNMIGFIQQNYKNKISLSDIAASGAVGESKCCKLFARYLGKTPIMYLNQYRLDKSMFLLRTTDKSIMEIATEIGFCGGSYYAEIFRKWIGLSPTAYRNSQNEIEIKMERVL